MENSAFAWRQNALTEMGERIIPAMYCCRDPTEGLLFTMLSIVLVYSF